MDVMQSTEAQTITQHAARGDRVARTREAIISSTLTLAQDGEVSPIVRDIAKLAGVSARTVFQHFADTAELYVAVLGRVMTSVLGETPQLNRQLPLDQRIGVERYEAVRPMWTFLQTLQRRSADAAAKLLQVYAGNREQISDSFGPELSALPGEKRERTLNALNVALTPETWIVLRERLGLTVDQAREEWRFIVKAIFSDHH